MKVQVVKNIFRKLEMDIKGGGNGEFHLSNLSFVEGRKKCSLGEIKVNWDFSEFHLRKEEDEWRGEGISSFELIVKDLRISSERDKGEFSIESLHVKSYEDLKSMMLLIPNEILGMFVSEDEEQ